MITKTIVYWATLIIWAPFKTNPVWHCYIFPHGLLEHCPQTTSKHVCIYIVHTMLFVFFGKYQYQTFRTKMYYAFMLLKKPNFIGELFENTWNLQFLITKTRYNIFQLVYWWNIKKYFQRKTVIWVYGWSPSWWPLWERTCLAGGPLRTWNVTRPLSIR